MNLTPTLDVVREWFGLTRATRRSDHNHGSAATREHGHKHGVIDPTIVTTERGIWALKWSFVILAITAALQAVVVLVTGSAALLADTIHNISDATTAIPLWIAFRLAQRKPTPTFTYGYGRVEDLAGITIVLVILLSALIAGYESIQRLINPQPVILLGWVFIAGIIGFIGNEIVAVLRIRVGREINSAALIADGYHSRTDGFTSLAVVLGAIGVWLGFPLADPIIGLLITLAIFGIVWQSAKAVLTRMLDGVDPSLVDEIRHSVEHVSGIKKILHVKARWLGHQLHTDVAVSVDEMLSVADADRLAEKIRRELFSHISELSVANIRVQGFEAAERGVRSATQTEGSHHAPEPVAVASLLATGLLEIIKTPDGERMRLTVGRHAAGLEAKVTIDRSGGHVETLDLVPHIGTDGVFISTRAPDEPHEFKAHLRLKTADKTDALSFQMVEPVGHKH